MGEQSERGRRIVVDHMKIKVLSQFQEKWSELAGPFLANSSDLSRASDPRQKQPKG
jgi:hypothetical protein